MIMYKGTGVAPSARVSRRQHKQSKAENTRIGASQAPHGPDVPSCPTEACGNSHLDSLLVSHKHVTHQHTDTRQIDSETVCVTQERSV